MRFKACFTKDGKKIFVVNGIKLKIEDWKFNVKRLCNKWFGEAYDLKFGNKIPSFILFIESADNVPGFTGDFQAIIKEKVYYDIVIKNQ